MLFTNISAEGWVMIVGAAFIGLNTILNTFLNWTGNRKIDESTKITKKTSEDSIMMAKDAAESLMEEAAKKATVLLNNAAAVASAVAVEASKSIKDQVIINTARIDRLDIHAKNNADHLVAVREQLNQIMVAKGLADPPPPRHEITKKGRGQ